MDGISVPSVKQVAILCNGCAQDALEESVKDGDVFWIGWAKFGPSTTMQPEDIAILAAPRFHEAKLRNLRQARRMTCEKCGARIYVHPSSQWLLDLKAKLEART